MISWGFFQPHFSMILSAQWLILHVWSFQCNKDKCEPEESAFKLDSLFFCAPCSHLHMCLIWHSFKITWTRCKYQYMIQSSRFWLCDYNKEWYLLWFFSVLMPDKSFIAEENKENSCPLGFFGSTHLIHLSPPFLFYRHDPTGLVLGYFCGFYYHSLAIKKMCCSL